MKYCVYKHEAPDGRVYIGITNKNPIKRWKNGFGYRLQIVFFSAIVKYGWDNFKHEILFSDLSEEEAILKETELIIKYQSNNIEHGFNITLNYKKEVQQIDKVSGVVLAEYSSIAEAEKKTGINNRHISDVCNGKRKSAGGFYWKCKYSENYLL